MKNEEFLKENFQLRRGANRAKLYRRYKKNLLQEFQPTLVVEQRANKMIKEF